MSGPHVREGEREFDYVECRCCEGEGCPNCQWEGGWWEEWSPDQDADYEPAVMRETGR